MLDDILDYIENIRDRPVWQPIPGSVRARFQAAVPAGPTDLAAVHDEFMRDILPYATGNVHPGFMGWVHGGGNVPGMLAEMLAAGLNANLGGRDHMPIEVERQIVHWLRQLFGFPDTASGLFVTGTSMANLFGVLIARTRDTRLSTCVATASQRQPSVRRLYLGRRPRLHCAGHGFVGPRHRGSACHSHGRAPSNRYRRA